MKKIYSTITIGIFLILSISCNRERKEWEKVKKTENVQELEKYLSDFPKSVCYDSALLNLEKLIYKKSLNSKSRPGTFEEYENYIMNYSRIKELINVDEKVRYLKLKADTIEINGRLVDTLFKAVPDIIVSILPVNEKGDVSSEAFISSFNSRSRTNKDGEFLIKIHRSIFEANTRFVMEASPLRSIYSDLLMSDTGLPIFFNFDPDTRVMNVGSIKVKYKNQ